MQTLSPQLSTIDEMIQRYRCADKAIVLSSSFQSQSIPLLHITSTLAPEIPVAFLDTGYHFPETISFRDEVVERLDLNLIVLQGHEQPSASGLYVTSESRCCTVNKVEPLHVLLDDFDVWMSGVRSDQTATRNAFRPTMPGPVGTERYHPMLDWTAKDVDSYRREFNLPSHPLESLGYSSIGCEPCTSPLEPSISRAGDAHVEGAGTTGMADRSGRWSSSEKTECGLHLDR